mgnify:FL=1
MKYIYRLLIFASILTAADSGARSLEIAAGDRNMSWPPASTVQMTEMPDGSFNVAMLGLSAGTYFCIADRDGNGSPVALGPSGDKNLGADGNAFSVLASSHDKIEVSDAVRRPSGVSSIDEFDLWTDKARYAPGQEVWIQASKFHEVPGAIVRYRRGADIIEEHPLVQEWWPWTPPADDFEGYLVDVYSVDDNGNEHIHGSIGVDVSSDWKRFPRYGYTAWYEPSRLDGITGDIAFLNRRHINAVQFQDWHLSHHRPYCGDAVYTDIARREVSLEVVKKNIEVQHAFNMESFFYNLGFGALEKAGAAADGVKEEWYYYRDSNHSQKDYHTLPSDWKSDISFVDPGNAGWQAYLVDRNREVYDNLDFDGFQVDQVGYRGDDTYDYWGNRFNLCDRFPSLLKALKNGHPDKRLIMNSVSKYGASGIASSGVIDVCYNECWADTHSFMDLYWIVFDNNNASGNTVRTVFANYMNYDYGKNNWGKEFNPHGVLLTDACIFALGAGHLELGSGGNMLCNEYFPNTNLRIGSALTEAITRYYDFATAYETLIYDTVRELTPDVTPLEGTPAVSVWNYQRGPQPRKIVIRGTETRKGQLVYHLLNFRNVNSLSWRDLNADQPEPEPVSDIRLSIDVDRMVSRVWVASPDTDACVPLELPFAQQGNAVTVTVPSLRYWSMLVFE